MNVNYIHFKISSILKEILSDFIYCSFNLNLNLSNYNINEHFLLKETYYTKTYKNIRYYIFIHIKSIFDHRLQIEMSDGIFFQLWSEDKIV